ncbi:MAG: hypothetical protein AAF604_23255 [Acidobacteriota bacterium]
MLQAMVANGELNPAVVTWAALKLSFGHCSTCRKAVVAFSETVRRRVRLGGERARAYEAVGFGLLDGEIALRQDRKRAQAAISALAELAPDERLAKVRRARQRFRSPSLVEEALSRASVVWSNSPEEARSWIALADELTKRLYGRSYSPAVTSSLALRVQGYRANLSRIVEDYRRAEVAWARLRQDPRRLDILEPEAVAELFSLEASLASARREFARARALLNKGLSLFRLGDSRDGVSSTLIQLAIVEAHEGGYSSALGLLEEAQSLLRPGNALKRAGLLHNRALYLAALNRFDSAEQTLLEFEEALAGIENKGLERLLFSLRARVAVGRGQLGEAEVALKANRKSYLDAKLYYNSALSTLDLAELLLDQGRLSEVQSLAQETLAVFERQQVPAEAARAIALFTRAALAERLTVALLSRLRRGLGGPG